MKNTLETRLGIFFALAVLAAALILEVAGGLSVFKKGYHVHALFTNINELQKDDPVKMAGVQIGRVDSIRFAEGKVRVTMKIDDRTALLRNNSKAVIKFTGLMGENFVSLDFGTAEGARATEGTTLMTGDQPDLNALMARLDSVAEGVENLTKSLGADNFSNLLAPFTDFMKENRPRLTGILSNMQEVSTQVAAGQGTIGKLVKDDALYTSAIKAVDGLGATTEDLKLVAAQAKEIVGEINAGRGTLGKLARDEQLYVQTTDAMTNLKEILQKINHGQGSVGKLVNDDSFYKNVKLTLQKLDKATEGLEDQGPLTVLGIAVNNLF